MASRFRHAALVGRYQAHGIRSLLEEIARTHGVTARQVALAFLVRRPSLFTIPKASEPRHVLDNAAAGDLQLGDDEIARIDAAFPVGHERELPVL